MSTDDFDVIVQPTDLDATLMLLGEALSTGAPLTAARTHAAVQALITAAEYLSVAVGPAVSVSVPTQDDLAKVILGLHITLHRLHASLHHLSAGLGRREVANQVSIVEVAKLQSALGIAVDRLGTAALTVGAAGEVLAAPTRQG